MSGEGRRFTAEQEAEILYRNPDLAAVLDWVQRLIDFEILDHVVAEHGENTASWEALDAAHREMRDKVEAAKSRILALALNWGGGRPT